jgi:DNA polymerase V
MSFAAPAQEELANTITIGEYLLRDQDASSLLQMEGDALREEGILHGDMIVFERTDVFKRGDLVVLLGEDGYAIRRYPMQGMVVGVVTATFRKYA